MYNEKLEALIDAALADGVLTEKEKQILFKKAQEMGVDLDEFEMVLDARLVKFKKAEEEKVQASAPKSNKLGDVKKCPACGAIVQSYQGTCPDCGYAFENLDVNYAAKELSNLLRRASGDKEMSNIIDTFPVPMEKGALLEFISWIGPQSLDVKNPLVKSYQKKYDEVITKARLSFSADADFIPFFTKYEKDKKTILKNNILFTIQNILTAIKNILTKKWTWIGLIILFIIIGIRSCWNWLEGEEDCSEANELYVSVKKALDKNDFTTAEEIIKKYNGWEGCDNFDAAVFLLFSHYLKNDDLDNATRMMNEENGEEQERMIKELCDYHIEKGEYQEAESILNIKGDSYSSNSHIGHTDVYFVRNTVIHMCKNGKKNEAQKLLNARKSAIEKRFSNTNRENEIQEIQSIIDSY